MFHLSAFDLVHLSRGVRYNWNLLVPIKRPAFQVECWVFSVELDAPEPMIVQFDRARKFVIWDGEK